MNMNIEITNPIKVEASKYYLLVIQDAEGIRHFWNFDGTYDGYDKPCECSENEEEEIVDARSMECHPEVQVAKIRAEADKEIAKIHADTQRYLASVQDGSIYEKWYENLSGSIGRLKENLKKLEERVTVLEIPVDKAPTESLDTDVNLSYDTKES